MAFYTQRFNRQIHGRTVYAWHASLLVHPGEENVRIYASWSRRSKFLPEKIELIVMGGTFPSFPKVYKNEFITYAFKALNDFSKLFFVK